MSTLPCWLCGKTLDLRSDKNGKLYVICDPCGLQSFIRRTEGMQRLNQLIKELDKKKYSILEQSQNLIRVQGILREIDAIKTEITKLDNRIGFLFPDMELMRARDALRKRINQLLKELERIGDKQ